MSDLISREALLDAFREYMVENYDRERCASEENCKTCERGCLWRKVVIAVPAVDAVEVVYCDKCIYSNSCEIEGMLLGDGIEKPYCAGGERREENENHT